MLFRLMGRGIVVFYWDPWGHFVPCPTLSPLIMAVLGTVLESAMIAAGEANTILMDTYLHWVCQSPFGSQSRIQCLLMSLPKERKINR